MWPTRAPSTSGVWIAESPRFGTDHIILASLWFITPGDQYHVQTNSSRGTIWIVTHTSSIYNYTLQNFFSLFPLFWIQQTEWNFDDDSDMWIMKQSIHCLLSILASYFIYYFYYFIHKILKIKKYKKKIETKQILIFDFLYTAQK